MSLTVNAKAYTPDSFGVNVVGYIGPGKTGSVKDDLVLRRVEPKPTAVFSGVSRSAVKLTRTLTLTGALTPKGEGILELSVSMPVGAATVDVEAMLDDIAAWAATADASALVQARKISF